MPNVGATLTQDPEDSLVYGMDWSDFIGESGTLSASEWTIVPITVVDDTTLTKDNDSIGALLQTTQVRLIGGTAGRKYRIENKVTIVGTPTQTAERSFFLKVKER